ncbi:MAG: CPBP family intramembrane metalloprotease [Deltaproteobacteria bacterium]|nr:CPBP family intramembrane metalloprotease [Deltaproteobacteria bacterium]
MSSDKNSRISLPAALGWVALYLLAVVIAQIAVATAFYGGGILYFTTLEEMEAGQALAELQTADLSLLMQILSTLPSLLLVLLVTWLFRRFRDGQGLSSLGLGRPDGGWFRTVTFGLAAGFLAVGLMVALLWASGGYRFTGISHSWSTWWMLPTLVGAAFVEELIMRGYVLQKIWEAGSLKWAVILSSLLFWLFHSLNPAAWSSPLVAINLFGAGIVLALAYLASGNLWFPTVVHFAWNAAQGVLLELPISGIETDGLVDLELTDKLPFWLTGGAFGFEASLLATVSEAFLALLFLWIYERRLAASLEPGPAGLTSEHSPTGSPTE